MVIVVYPVHWILLGLWALCASVLQIHLRSCFYGFLCYVQIIVQHADQHLALESKEDLWLLQSPSSSSLSLILIVSCSQGPASGSVRAGLHVRFTPIKRDFFLPSSPTCLLMSLITTLDDMPWGLNTFHFIQIVALHCTLLLNYDTPACFIVLCDSCSKYAPKVQVLKRIPMLVRYCSVYYVCARVSDSL